MEIGYLLLDQYFLIDLVIHIILDWHTKVNQEQSEKSCHDETARHESLDVVLPRCGGESHFT